MSDQEIYTSDEYKARIERSFRSLTSLAAQRGDFEALNTAAESIAYWQMRTVKAEEWLRGEGFISFPPESNREEL